jgi:hypothetical protein
MTQEEAEKYVDISSEILPPDVNCGIIAMIRNLYQSGYSIESVYSGEDYEKQQARFRRILDSGRK